MMRLAVICAAVFILVVACSSNQTSSSENNSIYNSVDRMPADLEKKPENTDSSVNGKLTDEHVKMYIAVRIKREQIRYTREFSQASRSGGMVPAATLEQEAIGEFDIDPGVYMWAKKTIRRTLALAGNENAQRSIIKDQGKNSVLLHNIAMLKKHMDGISFAEKYRLPGSHPIQAESDELEITENPHLVADTRS